MGARFDSLTPYLDSARALISKKGSIGELVFTKGVYQVEVREGTEVYWPFLQISDDGELKEFFCTCDSSPCVHVAAGYLEAFGKAQVPLHVQFFRSFSYHVCCQCASQEGYDKTLFLKPVDSFSLRTLNAAGKRLQQELTRPRIKETPENSLKFSNLSAQEIDKWREGRPSKELRFLLSPWFDLARFLFALEPQMELDILEDSSGVPTDLVVKADGVEVCFSFDQEGWSTIIPSLRSLPKGPAVHSEPEGDIQGLIYLPSERAFEIVHKKSKEDQMLSKVSIAGKWLYKRAEGFYPLKGEPFFKRERIETNEVSKALTYHLPSMRLWSTNTVFSDATVSAQYKMKFDEGWNWHFELYIHTPGDMKNKEYALFGDWVFLGDKGFFPLKGRFFDQIDYSLPASEVSAFIQKHRIWLNSQKGFETHLAHMESQVKYTLDSENGLSFHSKLGDEEGQSYHDFGEWIYFEGEGFYSKSHQKLTKTIMSGSKIPLSEIPNFIRENREDLESVEGFFTTLSKIRGCGLNVSFREDGALEVLPSLDLEEGYKGILFGDFVYLFGEGFVDVPLQWRLPHEFCKEMVLQGDGAAEFLFEKLPKLEKLILNLDPRCKQLEHPHIELNYLVKSAEGGLRAGFNLLVEGGSPINLRRVLEAYEQGEALFVTPNGSFRLHGAEFSWLQQLRPSQTDDENFEMNTLEFLRLDANLHFRLPKEAPAHFEVSKRLIDQLRQFSVSQLPDLKGLKSTLRQYQQNGVNWLWFLYSFGLSGLLCDDMGLGKTHQSMGLMAAIDAEFRGKARFIVVCPTSVIYHWEDKLAQFLPKVKVYTFHGQKRTLPSKKFDGILLTSYGTLRVERKRLKEFHFTLAVFDEVHLAKNAASITHSVLASLQTSMRLGLTGTPIENNLKELKALFDIVLPGLMPTVSIFRERFLLPIERDFDKESKALLSAMIRPFVLRRRKQEVLTELPEKSEDKLYCELYDHQKELYSELIDLSKKQFLPELRDRDSKISYVHIFSILGKLKQVCNHPALYLKDIENYKEYQSGKWDLFVEKLCEARESAQKVVVFSQYLGMLDIMKLFLQEEGWEYAEIRGDTKNRREELKRFKEDPNCTVFLGSLQAAGLGIDLTAAEVVIFYDRWWNAARENQATDRVHRMGQTRGVQVYKLITKMTLEEKIDQLITKKGRLMEEVVTSDDQDVLKTFSRSDLIEILSIAE